MGDALPVRMEKTALKEQSLFFLRGRSIDGTSHEEQLAVGHPGHLGEAHTVQDSHPNGIVA